MASTILRGIRHHQARSRLAHCQRTRRDRELARRPRSQNTAADSYKRSLNAREHRFDVGDGHAFGGGAIGAAFVLADRGALVPQIEQVGDVAAGALRDLCDRFVILAGGVLRRILRSSASDTIGEHCRRCALASGLRYLRGAAVLSHARTSGKGSRADTPPPTRKPRWFAS